MSKIDDAKRIKDLSLSIAKKHGGWTDVGEQKYLKCDFNGISILHRTPFQRLKEADENSKYLMAIVGGKHNLPYGLDIWTTKKVFNVEWDDGGAFEILSFKRGDWEAALAATQDS